MFYCWVINDEDGWNNDDDVVLQNILSKIYWTRSLVRSDFELGRIDVKFFFKFD